jgi:hypothetical protein
VTLNLAPYHFYMKVTGDEAEDAFSGQTVPLEVDESEKVAKTVLASSRKQYATPKAKVEKYLDKLFAEPEKKPAWTQPKKTTKAQPPERNQPRTHDL